MLQYIKSFLFIMIAPVIIVTCFFQDQINVKDNRKCSAVKVSYVKNRYDFSKVKLAFRE